VSDPYRTSASPPEEAPQKRHWRRWFCDRGWHSIRVTRVLKGGEGPDDAGWEVVCTVCGADGYKYCGGGLSSVFNAVK